MGIDLQNLLVQAIDLQRRGQYRKGLAVIDKALAADATFAKGHYEKACLLCALGELDAAAESVKLAARHDKTEVRSMKRDSDLAALRGHPALGGLLGGGRGAPRPALPKALPTTIDAAFELLTALCIKLPRPSTGAARGELPAPLAAFYAKAARLPTTSNDSIVSLTARKRAAKDFAEELEEETEELEGLQRADFSPTAQLVVLGSSDDGGTYFLDPDRWGEIVFELAHDEAELRPETETLGAFVAREALGEWALDEGLDEAFYALTEKGRRAARARLTERRKLAAKKPAAKKPAAATKKKSAAKKPATRR